MADAVVAAFKKLDALIKLITYDNWVEKTTKSAFGAEAATYWKWISEVQDNWLNFAIGLANIIIGFNITFLPELTLTWLFAHDMTLPHIEKQEDKDSAYVWIYICTTFIGLVHMLVGVL